MAMALRILLLLLLFAPPAWAGNVVVILSEASGPYSEFASGLRNALEGSPWKITRQGSFDQVEEAIAQADLVIAAGSNALRQITSHDSSVPILATLIPRQAYESQSRESNRTRRISAIFLDQPVARQAAFLRHLLPGKTRIGMLLSRETASRIAGFRTALSSAGLSLDTEESDDDRSLLTAANSLLPRVNALLATPDITIYKRDNIKAILMTTYRHQRPVVAFSAAFVNAGALAALYSTPTQIAQQSAGILREFGTNLPAPVAPAQFVIQINQSVADALDLKIPEESEIRRAMLADKEGR